MGPIGLFEWNSVGGERPCAGSARRGWGSPSPARSSGPKGGGPNRAGRSPDPVQPANRVALLRLSRLGVLLASARLDAPSLPVTSHQQSRHGPPV